MDFCKKYIVNYARTTAVWLLVMVGGMLPASGKHYIRLNVDGAYVQDLAGANQGAPYTHTQTPISLTDARAWIGSGGYESLKASNGFSPSLGVGYRYMYKALIVDAGLGIEYRCRYNNVYDLSDVVNQDTILDPTKGNEPLDFIGHYFWTERKTRRQHLGLHLPVMIGAEWKGFYIMAGVKANLDLWSQVWEEGLYTNSGIYTKFMEPIPLTGEGFHENDPYRTDPINHLTSVRWELRACGEIGYCISGHGKKAAYSRKEKPSYYLGAFAEYGFAGSQDYYRSLFAGVRLTVLLPIAESEKCNCLPY